MFITNYTKHKCSKCGAIDKTETVTTAARGVIVKTLRCLDCRHEKIISTTKVAEYQKPVIYELQQKQFEEF